MEKQLINNFELPNAPPRDNPIHTGMLNGLGFGPGEGPGVGSGVGPGVGPGFGEQNATGQ